MDFIYFKTTRSVKLNCLKIINAVLKKQSFVSMAYNEYKSFLFLCRQLQLFQNLLSHPLLEDQRIDNRMSDQRLLSCYRLGYLNNVGGIHCKLANLCVPESSHVAVTFVHPVTL